MPASHPPLAPRTNQFGQTIGAALPGWSPRPKPPRTPIEGRLCRLEPLSAERHAADLHAAHALAPDGRDWTYLSVERAPDAASARAYVELLAQSADPMHFAVIDLPAQSRPVLPAGRSGCAAGRRQHRALRQTRDRHEP